MSSVRDSRAHEQARQQALMVALLQRGGTQGLDDWMASRPAGLLRGLQAYRANAGASAERALAASYPTVQALVGAESFAALARACWHAHPPERGDLAQWGAALPAFIAASKQLADVPYLADSARLDGLVAAAERAHETHPLLDTLHLLSEVEPGRLRLTLRPGTALLSSAYPVASVWHAHRQPDDDPAVQSAAVAAALAAGSAEHVVVARDGWRATVVCVDAATARWMHSLLRGETLACALDAAGPGFVFEAWLAQAVQRQWLWQADATGCWTPG